MTPPPLPSPTYAPAPSDGSGGSGVESMMGVVGWLSDTAFPWVSSYWGHEARMRNLRAQEAVGLAREGAGRSGVYALTPQPYAFPSGAGAPGVRSPGLSSLAPYLPWIALAVLVFVLVR